MAVPRKSDVGDAPVGRVIIKDASGKVIFTESGVTFPYVWDLKTRTGGNVPDGLYEVEAYVSAGLRYGSAFPCKLVVRRGKR